MVFTCNLSCKVIYLTMTMALGTLSVCLTVLVLNLHHRDAERPVPRWARVLVLRYLAKLLCVRARKPKTMAANLDLTLPDEDAADGTDIKDGLRHVSMTEKHKYIQCNRIYVLYGTIECSSSNLCSKLTVLANVV